MINIMGYHTKCDDCGERHTPGNKEECMEVIRESIEDLTLQSNDCLKYEKALLAIKDMNIDESTNHADLLALCIVIAKTALMTNIKETHKETMGNTYREEKYIPSIESQVDALWTSLSVANESFKVASKRLKSRDKKIQELISVLTIANRKVIHCDDCGSSWYDDGFTSKCPSCIITQLQAEVKELKRQVQYWHNLGAK
jgi:rubrerythrin